MTSVILTQASDFRAMTFLNSVQTLVCRNHKLCNLEPFAMFQYTRAVAFPILTQASMYRTHDLYNIDPDFISYYSMASPISNLTSELEDWFAGHE